jgi:tRNA threonylcarbamoyladenosine modification (KEOPS) complex  Pcc1 subunit
MTLTLKSCKARIKVSLSNKRTANSLRAALSPDLSCLPKEGEGSARISLYKSSVIFKIEAEDISSLRANINSNLLLADASYRCLK